MTFFWNIKLNTLITKYPVGIQRFRKMREEEGWYFRESRRKGDDDDLVDSEEMTIIATSVTVTAVALS